MYKLYVYLKEGEFVVGSDEPMTNIDFDEEIVLESEEPIASYEKDADGVVVALSNADVMSRVQAPE